MRRKNHSSLVRNTIETVEYFNIATDEECSSSSNSEADSEDERPPYLFFESAASPAAYVDDSLPHCDRRSLSAVDGEGKTAWRSDACHPSPVHYTIKKVQHFNIATDDEDETLDSNNVEAEKAEKAELTLTPSRKVVPRIAPRMAPTREGLCEEGCFEDELKLDSLSSNSEADFDLEKLDVQKQEDETSFNMDCILDESALNSTKHLEEVGGKIVNGAVATVHEVLKCRNRFSVLAQEEEEEDQQGSLQGNVKRGIGDVLTDIEVNQGSVSFYSLSSERWGIVFGARHENCDDVVKSRKTKKKRDAWKRRKAFRSQPELIKCKRHLDIEDEELEELANDKKYSAPLYGTWIIKTEGQQSFKGKVDDIEIGIISRNRLYRILYTDGDIEHFTRDEVERYKINNNLDETSARAPAYQKSDGLGANENQDEVSAVDKETSLEEDVDFLIHEVDVKGMTLRYYSYVHCKSCDCSDVDQDGLGGGCYLDELEKASCFESEVCSGSHDEQMLNNGTVSSSWVDHKSGKLYYQVYCDYCDEEFFTERINDSVCYDCELHCHSSDEPSDSDSMNSES